MKTYLSIICLIVLCACQSYNRLSGGGFYTKSSQESKEIEKDETVSFQETQVELEIANNELSSLNYIETEDVVLSLNEKIPIKNDTIKFNNQSNNKSDIDTSLVKEKIEPLGLVTLGVSLLNAAGLVSTFFVYPKSIELILWGIVLLSFATVVMSIISLVRVVKNPEKYFRNSNLILGLILFLSSITFCASLAFLIFTKTFSLF